jgi:hypothetical protein
MGAIFQTLPCLISGHLYLFSDIFKSLAEGLIRPIFLKTPVFWYGGSSMS